jgi:hypothetical protein
MPPPIAAFVVMRSHRPPSRREGARRTRIEHLAARRRCGRLGPPRRACHHSGAA